MAKVRGYREGTIRLRGDGYWEARLRRPGQKSRFFYDRSKRKVEMRLAEARRDQERGLLGASRVSVGQFLRWWLDEVVRDHVRARTWERYDQVVRDHLAELAGIPLERLGPEPIQQLLNRLARSGRAPEKAFVVLRNALNAAVNNRRISWNPANQVKLPRWHKVEPRTLRAHEAASLRAALVGDPFEALYVLALSCAMREGELLGLRWSDVDLARREIRIERQLQAIPQADGGHRLELVDVKSAASRRTLPLPAIGYDALLAHRERQRVASLHGLVFTTSRGTPINARNLIRSFKALLEKAGLPDMRFHDLRHSAATFLIASRVDPKTVQAILGHTSSRLTMDLYAHAVPEALRDAAHVMDRVLGRDA